MLLEKLLNELKPTLKKVAIRKLPDSENMSSEELYDFFKNKKGIYSGGFDNYIFKVKVNTDKIQNVEVKELVEKYGFVIINLRISRTSENLYGIIFHTRPDVGFNTINYGNPLATMRKIGNVINNLLNKNPNVVYYFTAAGKRMNMYKSLIKSLGGEIYFGEHNDMLAFTRSLKSFNNAKEEYL